MKLKYFLPMAAFALPLIAGAVPAKPGVHQMTNPDGSKVNVQCFGDEFFSFYTDAQGKKLMEINAQGYMVPMVRDGIALENTAETIESLRAEMIKLDGVDRMKVAGMQRMAALNSQGRTTFPCIGKKKGLVVLVEFSDREFVIPNIKEKFNKLLNEEGYSDYNALGSARDFYKASSDNRFEPEFDVFGPIKLSKTAAYITGFDKIGSSTAAGKYLRMSELVYESLTSLDKEIDFSQYDGDNDGIVDNVFFFFAGHGQADYYGNEYDKRTCIWPHASKYTAGNLKLDGKTISSYACSMELDGGLSTVANRWLTGIGTFCHEFGHVLGLPDLYDTQNGNTKVPGGFSTMCSASYNMHSTCPVLFSSYEKWLCNWLEYNVLSEPCSVELVPLATTLTTAEQGKPDKRMRRLNILNYLGQPWANEYYLLENRSKVGFDRSVPEEGILLWHINYSPSRWTSNQVNCFNIPYVLPIGPSNGGNTWPNGTVNYITPEENSINLESYNATEYKDYITSMAYDPVTDLASFDYNLISEYPTLKTTLSIDTIDTDNRTFTLKWDELPDADSYSVTIYYINDSGTKMYVDNNNERNVGKETSVMVRNMTRTQFGREMHATVRAFKTLPSKEISNELVFIPANGLGVASLFGGDDVVIKGGVGCVIAPDDALVYNLAGMKVGKENLSKGLYLVRYGNKTVKVVVR